MERYAYFGSANGDESLLVNGGPALSALGQQYAYGGGAPQQANKTTGGGARRKCGHRRAHQAGHGRHG